MKKLTRDCVVSIVDGRELVGVYWKGTKGRNILFETTPEQADAIIEIFNNGMPGDGCMYDHDHLAHPEDCEWHN